MNDDPERMVDGELIDVDSEAAPSRRAVTEYREPAAPSHPLDADPAQFAVQVQRRGENYAMLVSWLVDNLDPATDVVQVHFVKRDKCEQGGPPRCTPSIAPYHWSEPDLSKSGVEKVCGLLGLGARFLGMQDFRRQALRGIRIEDVIVDCELYSSADGPAVSQGTGSCSRDEVKGDLNTAMKRACKRAHADALKRCSGLSGLAGEIRKRMAPVDPDRAVKEATDAQRRARYTGEGGGRWNTGAALTHWPVGVHKDKPLRELPGDYLDWCVKNMGDKPDLKRAAAEELSKRKRPGPSSTHTQPPSVSYDEQNPPPPEFDDEIPF